jgi:hypothetical protein
MQKYNFLAFVGNDDISKVDIEMTKKIRRWRQDQLLLADFESLIDTCLCSSIDLMCASLSAHGNP